MNGWEASALSQPFFYAPPLSIHYSLKLALQTFAQLFRLTSVNYLYCVGTQQTALKKTTEKIW